MRTLGLFGLFGLCACTLPTTIGLRSAGDLAPTGQTGVGGSLSAVLYGGVSPIPGATLDLDRSLTDHVGLAGDVGFFGPMGQAQGELRLSTAREGTWGAALLGGASTLVDGDTLMVGPYLGASGRRAIPGGFAYAGMKAVPTFSGGAHDLWLHPTLGWQHQASHQTWGVELTLPFILPKDADQELGALAWAPTPGLQVWVRGAPFADR